MLTIDDFIPLRKLAHEIAEAAQVDIDEELRFSTIARVPAYLTAKLADVLNDLSSKE